MNKKEIKNIIEQDWSKRREKVRKKLEVKNKICKNWKLDQLDQKSESSVKKQRQPHYLGD